MNPETQHAFQKTCQLLMLLRERAVADGRSLIMQEIEAVAESYVRSFYKENHHVA